MIAIGPHAFEEMLRGAERMDEHFRTTPFEKNLPVVMALLGIWNTNFLGASSISVLPYNRVTQVLPFVPATTRDGKQWEDGDGRRQAS